jgi:aspartyl-tRNA(Asn)/glutamyl-tRNA(Gln) amidotransferase subunit A
VRIGLSPTFFQRVHTETRLAVEQAARVFEAAAAKIVEVPEVQRLEGTEGFNFVWSDAALYHSNIDEGDQRLHPEVAALLRLGRSMTALDYARSMQDARRIRRSFRRALDEADVLLAPSTPYPAPPVTAEEVAVEGGTIDVHRGGPATFTVPINLSGLPALAFPVGRSTAGLPLGAQIIGRPWSERLLLDVGLIHEQARNQST